MGLFVSAFFLSLAPPPPFISGGEPYNATVIAAQISALAKGSVNYVYVIQNTDLNAMFDMVALLPPHVTLVGYGELVELARQRALRA